MDQSTPELDSSHPITKRSQNFNKWAYGVFTLAGLAFWAINDDRSLAPTFLAIALVGEPFDPSVEWSKRPWYQRAWLIAHLGLTAAAFGYWIGLMDSL